MESISRNERIIQLLKKLNLDPDHPPSDFEAVYKYALVEYGVGKPRSVVEIFRQKEIQDLFRKAFEQRNTALLINQAETQWAQQQLPANTQTVHIDVRRECLEFSTIFVKVAYRTQTPAEVLARQQVTSLQQELTVMRERMNRLPTLEGFRTEIARLALPASQPNQLPPSSSHPPAQPTTPLFALAQQMRGWFETLGFRFESHEIWQADTFEWIINIPVRRGRYDRILVRGIDGEAGLTDVQDLQQSVESQRTDEGWLVTARRISRAARDEVEKAENDALGCFTFDELLDQDADFSGYLSWLEAEIEKRGINEKYVPLACLKEEIDPDTHQRIGMSRYDDRDGWIDGYIDLWLDDPAKEHISVLGEFGTGKTWFAFHYAWKALQRYREAQQRGLERPRLPLVVPLRDYAKAVSVESLFSEFFFRKHEIPIPGYSAFEQLNRMGKLLLIFDGFDEMAARVDRQQMINNFWELAKVVVPGAKVILTCRTEHFPEAKEGRALLNAELQASTKDLTGETPQFEVLELEKFNDEQIRQVLSHQAQPATVEQIMGNPELLDLARRPVLTELILEALPDIEAGKPVDMSRVYLYAVRHKMERDIKAERTFTSMADKLYFMCELSWEMLSTNRMSINYREFPDRLRRLFGPMVVEEKSLDHWHYDMMGQTILIRNSDGDYKPAHRSLLEFFVAYKLLAELGVLASDFLTLAQQQSYLSDEPAQEYTWKGYFTRCCDQENTIQPIAPLQQFECAEIDKLVGFLAISPLAKAVLDLASPMLNRAVMRERLLGLIKTTQGKSQAEVGCFGGNLAQLLLRGHYRGLEGADLSGTVMTDVDFSTASLRRTTLTDAILTHSIFAKPLGGVASIAFSPDGRLIAIGDSNGAVQIWEVASRRLIFLVKGHQNGVRSVAFSPDGKTLASGSDD
ncbi:MAG: NACHT domain-containing protein, partial [Cyanobacteria bacterium P01_H01_bin.162]